MGLLKNIIGLCLIVISWFNLLDLSLVWRVVFFVIGFDLMSIWFKLLIFGIDFLFFETLGNLSWLMVILPAVDMIAKYVLPLGILLKPLVLFGILYFSNFNLYVCLAIAIVDLLINVRR